MREHIVVPESQYLDAKRGERLRSRTILRLCRFMLATVKFDGEFQFVAVEVENVSLPACLHRMLPAKLRSGEPPVAQQGPD